MASPAASPSGDDQKKMEQITFRFCSEWYNEDPYTISRLANDGA